MHRAIYWPLKIVDGLSQCRKDVETERYITLMKMFDNMFDYSGQYPVVECPPRRRSWKGMDIPSENITRKPVKISFGGQGISHLYVRSGRFKTPVFAPPLCL